jgi:ABC-type transport system involved in multi-copper enzyme maturation permease subunit
MNICMYILYTFLYKYKNTYAYIYVHIYMSNKCLVFSYIKRWSQPTTHTQNHSNKTNTELLELLMNHCICFI